MGYCAVRPVRYRVFASDQPDFTNKGRNVFESESCRVVKVDVPLQPTDRYLLLQIEGQDVPAFWLHPALHRSKKPLSLAKPGSRFVVDIDDNEKNDQFKINDVPKSTIPPLDLDQDSHCDEFLYAHAPSEVTYAIPQGAVSFSAIGYCLQSGDVDFQVRVDNRPDPIFRTGKTALAPVIVDLPEGATKVALVVDDLRNGRSDHAFWLYPRFHLKAKPAPAKKPATRAKSK